MAVACLLCRKNKKRCEGGTPCSRCKEAGLVCQFPEIAREPRVKVSLVKRKLAQVEGLVHNLGLTGLTPLEVEEKLRNKLSFLPFTDTPSQLDWFGAAGNQLPKLKALNNPNYNYSPVRIKQIPTFFTDHLLTIYANFIHPISPYIDLAKLPQSSYFDEPTSSPLLDAVYCRAYRFLLVTKNSNNINSLEMDHFYIKATRSLQALSSHPPTLETVQAELTITMEEFGQNLVLNAAKRLTKIIAQCHTLHLHQPSSLYHQVDDATMFGKNDRALLNRKCEELSTWVACVYSDIILSIFTQSPNFTTLDMNEMEEQMDYLDSIKSKIKGTQSRSSFDQSSQTPGLQFGSPISEFSSSAPFPSLSTSSSSTCDSPQSFDESVSDSELNEVWVGLHHLRSFITITRLSSLMLRLSRLKNYDFSPKTPGARKRVANARSLFEESADNAKDIFPKEITHDYITTTTLEQDSNVLLNLLIYITYHSIRMNSGVGLVEAATALTKIPKVSKTSCSGGGGCSSSRCGGGTKPKPPSSSTPSSGDLGCTPGRLLAYSGADSIVKGLEHATRSGYWYQFAPSSLMMASAIVMVMRMSDLDPSPESQARFSWANRNLDAYLYAWPVLGTKLKVGGKMRCGFDGCSSALPKQMQTI